MRLTGIFMGTLFALTSSVAQAEEKSWGDKISLTQEQSLADAIKNHNSSASEVLVKGKTEQVCLKKGCWLTLAGLEGSVRVTFKGYKFFVPLSLKDQTVRVQGVLKQEEISVADQKHFLKDEGRPQADIDAIVKPRVAYTMIASGIEKI